MGSPRLPSTTLPQLGQRLCTLQLALLHQSGFERTSPFPGHTYRTPHGLCEGYAKGSVAVEDGDADLDFGDLPVEVAGHDALPQKLHTMRLGLDAAPVAISAPSSPFGAVQISQCFDRFVLGDGTSACRLPRFCVLARGYDSISPPSGNCVVTFARVISAIRCDRSDVLIGRDLTQQVI